ncbi:MAG: hypothetical protein QUS11_06290 [Candidatus Fermentibacter sp.]|nr:hypothetical protein [Candidatus Fermentibacter sp.]
MAAAGGSGDREGRIVPRTPFWLRVSAGACILLALASFSFFLYFSDRVDDAVGAVESTYTAAGRRNGPAISNAIAGDSGITRDRRARTAALAAGSAFLAASVVLAVAGSVDRRRRMLLLNSMTSEWKEEKSSEIRGFISQHIGTLAQKRAELITANAYGVLDETAWHQELVYFINRVLRPHCGVDADVFSFVELKAMIEKQVSMLG